ncbi:MAG: TPM domain-containing protein, partial [Microbacterium sp.]
MALTATLAVLFGGAASAASATDPVDLGSGYVVDDAGVLSSGDISAAEQRLTDLYESTGVDLFVVYVDEFTNPSSSEQWANTVAEDNGLGVSQYVLAVATESRQYYISADSAGPLTEQQVADIEATLVPPLRDGDYAGAVTTAADGFQTALGGGTVGGDGGGGGGGFVTGLIVFLVIAAIAGIVIWLIVRSRRKKRASVGGGSAQGPAVEQLSTEELARRASTALIQTDDAVKTSEQELGFAKAQFGDAATVEFETALQTARENLNQAFTLKQQLDDSVPDTEEQTRSWNAQIIRLCEEANTGLDEKAADFDELRKLEQNAPESLARIQQRRGEAAASIDAATASLQTLSTRYASEALATVADNPQQARQRIAFADEQLSAASAAIAAGNGGEAAVSIRAAEEAVGQATLLEDAIDKLGADLAEGERSAAALITELEGDIAAASALPDPQGTVAAAIAVARTQVDAAKANLAGSAKRPLVTLQALEAANAQIDGVVAGVRDAAAQAQRAQQMLGQQMMQAQA